MVVDTAHDWTIAIGNWRVGLIEYQAMYPVRFTTIHVGPFETTTWLPAATVAWRIGGGLFAVTFVSLFVIARVFSREPRHLERPK